MKKKDRARNFSKAQKRAAYLLAGGRCEICGCKLPDDWHADHLYAYSKGGKTDVTNLQALCQTCNLKKGNKNMLIQWPDKFELREWQQSFFDDYTVADKPNYLLVATPGAGKTIASLKIAHWLLNIGAVKQVVVVCPTDHLRTQWIEDATNVNIHLTTLEAGWDGRVVLTEDFHGVVTTYHQVARPERMELLRAFSHRKNTFVIFDEIHHCGESENLTWGDSIKQAFQHAHRRLLLSGTPFRSDNNPIPFVDYQTDPNDPKIRRSFADFAYGYGDALRDENVVRHIIFPAWGGTLVWKNFGLEKKATFEDQLTDIDSKHRLKTAIHPTGDWMRDVLTAANDKLDYIRNEEGHKDAGGLVIAQDQMAALQIADALKDITGKTPVVAISDVEESSMLIKKFRNSTKKWIVAVKMVSEGVDIKRLRVGVYATNILTRTFFRQAIGRVIRWDSRWDELDDQVSWFYIPEDPRLVVLMKEIREQIFDYIKEQEEADKRDRQDGTSMDLGQLALSVYEFTHSEGEEGLQYFNGEGFSKEELSLAVSIFNIPGFERVPAAAKALALRKLKEQGQYSPQSSASIIKEPAQTVPKQETVKNLKSEIKKKVGRLIYICREEGINIPGGSPYATIHGAWGKNNRYSKQSTIQQLEHKLTWLEGLIARALNGDKSITREFS